MDQARVLEQVRAGRVRNNYKITPRELRRLHRRFLKRPAFETAYGFAKAQHRIWQVQEDRSKPSFSNIYRIVRLFEAGARQEANQQNGPNGVANPIPA